MVVLVDDVNQLSHRAKQLFVELVYDGKKRFYVISLGGSEMYIYMFQGSMWM